MTTIEVAPASGGTALHAELAQGQSQFERFGSVATGLSGQATRFVGPGDYAAKARRRIAELRNAPSPWAEPAPVVFPAAINRGHEIAVQLGQPTAVVSVAAEAAAIAVFSHFALEPPPSAVAIFPREDGGLRLQTVGQERAVGVDISAAGNEFACEYAGDDVYHTETIRNADDAARFIIDSTR